jgi:hypothetical protein
MSGDVRATEIQRLVLATFEFTSNAGVARDNFAKVQSGLRLLKG